VDEMKAADSTVYEAAAYGLSYSLLMNYQPSAAWTWMVYGKDSPKVILYNDI
jgi:hypothetical protein